MDAIALLASTMDSDKYTYSNLSGTVASLMSDILIANKKLVEDLKEKPHLERLIRQCHQIAGATGGGRSTGRGVTAQQKKGPTTAGHAGKTQGTLALNSQQSQ